MGRMDRSTSRHSFGCPDEHWSALDEIVEAEGHDSKSDLIRSLVAEKVNEHRDGDATPDDHIPADDKRRRVYLAALTESTDNLRVRDHHVTAIAEETQINADSVRAILHELRRSGYISLMGVPPDAVEADPIFRVKPRQVDPDEWTYREQQRDSEVSEHHLRAESATCISHHFTSDGDACLKCGTPRSEIETRSTCDRCESDVFDSALEDGLCPGCRSPAERARADGGERA